MHGLAFIQDMAIIMAIAGLVTVLFHYFKQPVVLGYIVAGVIIGPHTPPFGLIHEKNTVSTLAELGVIFLMFSLGLEFSLRKLRRVGATAFVAASFEIALMLSLGYAIGRAFDWKPMDALFLGAMLAISSTTIIVKALAELGMKRERFAQLIFGVLIVEDILAIGMIALLSGIAISGSVEAEQVFGTVGKLSLFMVVALVVGILIVPRVLNFVAGFESNETLLIAVLGLCFGFCLLVTKLEYSVALGAFLIGAIMAEARQLRQIEHLIEPIRDMFSAIFFVTIGLLLDPNVLLQYAWPIAIITLAVVFGKVISCSAGSLLAGNDGRTSLRVGMGLAQIGEFSFIIATLGLQLKVTSEFLYPIAVAVSAITTLLTPYLIRLADPLSAHAGRWVPAPIAQATARYGDWLHSLQPQGGQAALAHIVQRSLLQVLVNFALVAGIFFASSQFAPQLGGYLEPFIDDVRWRRTLIWSAALLLSLPFLVAVYRKAKALSMLLAEISIKPEQAGHFTAARRRVISELLPLLTIVVTVLLLCALSIRILPPMDLLMGVLAIAIVFTLLMWRRLVRLQSRLQIALMETMEEGKQEQHEKERDEKAKDEKSQDDGTG